MAVEAILIGAGQRGAAVYGAYALARPERLRIVAVAEPDPGRRRAFAEAHALPETACHPDWRPLLAAQPSVPVAIVATGDTAHVEPARACLERGYHVLLEKPMAPGPADCVGVVAAAERAGRVLQIGHVLRYTPFYGRVAELVAEGTLGRILHIDMREHVAHWHMTHSYVRGKFRNQAIAAPILLAKSCHDLDLMVWFAGAPVRRVSSFGSRSHYRRERAPEGAPLRCTDGCPVQDECPHDAVRLYLGPDDSLARFFPWSDVSPEPSPDARRRALESGPYGLCAYHADNDVLDHQIVALEFENGPTASFGLHGLATHEERTLRITGSRAELRGRLHEGVLEIQRLGALEPERVELPGSAVGHFGGDEGLLDHFTGLVERAEFGSVRASGRSALESHLVGFAAEQARREGGVVEMEAFRRAYGAGAT